jgi:hypothetical protein
LIVLHVGTRSEGLIDGCDLVFLAKSKDGDYHQEMNSVVFLEWFKSMRSMRVGVSLDFDILIESFISLCTIETVGAIFHEYKPWIVLLITQ